MIYFAVLVLLVIAVYLFLQHPQFGRAPSGERRQRIESSPNYRRGAFQNLSHTPALAEGTTYASVMREYFFNKEKRTSPSSPLPVHKTDLSSLDPATDLIIWFGHSSYYIQLSGKRILVDPVLSSSASPLPWMVRSFKGTDVYTPQEIPHIDYLIITHDHYDHLDHSTLVGIREKVGNVITALGVGEHLERWGYRHDKIRELDWHEEAQLDDVLRVIATPARHFSGRLLNRNNTLWASFVLISPQMKIFIGGDSGYDTHFREIGEKYGPFRLAILENGQYNAGWKYIHMMPEEAVAAAIELRADYLLPVHWSRFSLSLHAWDDSIRRVVEEADRKNLPVIHPKIGEPIFLQGHSRTFARWWEELD